jgi:hypothetical protein
LVKTNEAMCLVVWQWSDARRFDLRKLRERKLSTQVSEARQAHQKRRMMTTVALMAVQAEMQ